MDISEFQSYLQSEEKSSNTIEKYIRDVHRFNEYVGTRELSKDIVIAYKKELIDNNYAVRSINSMLASINAYLRYVDRIDCVVKSLRIQRQTYCAEEKELTKTEYIRLINAANNQGNYRLKLILETICATGIRVSELQYITVEAVKKGEALISLKGKTRYIFIVKQLRKRLLEYAKKNRIEKGVLFISRNGSPLNRTNIWRDMKKLCNKAGVNERKVYPHNLRHLFARTFYNVEKDIVKLADILGHSSIDTTRIYTITSGYEHRRRMEKLRLII